MPVRTQFFGPRAQNTHKVIIDVEDQPVLSLIDKIYGAISSLGLSEFLKIYASPYFEDQIIRRFAGHGSKGIVGGSWDPLEDSTIRIRHALGFHDDQAINERTGELLHYVAYTRDFGMDVLGATMTIPEQGADPALERKLQTAQEGYVQGEADMIPGAITPPRPVLALSADDELEMHRLLHMHIAYWVATHSRVTP